MASSDGRGRHLRPLLVWVGALVAGTALFHWLGDGALAAPPPDAAGFQVWLAERDPLVATLALLRLVVLALAWYLVGATTVGIVARLARASRLVRLADALTLPAVRRLLRSSLGVSLAATMVVGSVPGANAVASAVTSTVTLAAADTEEVAVGTVRLTPILDDASQVRLRPAADDDEGDPAVAPESAVTPEVEPGDPAPAAPASDRAAAAELGAGTTADDAEPAGSRPGSEPDAPRRHEVRAGESFWSIAHQHVARTTGVAPTDAELAPYWREVVEHNRAQLADPANPDLLFPGQTVELPPFAEVSS